MIPTKQPPRPRARTRSFFIGLGGALALAGCAATDATESSGTNESAQLGDVRDYVDVTLFNFYGDSPGAAVIAAGHKDSEDTCLSHTFGACEVIACSRVPPAINAANAGPLSITGAGRSITIPVDPKTGDYTPWGATGDAYFQPGDRIQIHADGNPSGLAGFTRFLTAPTPIKLTSPILPQDPDEGDPPLPAEKKLHIDRTKDLVLTWSGGGYGKVQVDIFHTGAEDPDTSPTLNQVTCRFDPSKQTGTIPALALGFFPKVPEGYFTFQVFAVSHIGGAVRRGRVLRTSARGVNLGKTVDQTDAILFD